MKFMHLPTPASDQHTPCQPGDRTDRPVSSTPAHSVVLSEAQDARQRCPACGYRLYALPDRGRCPECGVPYDSTQLGDCLVFADRSWLVRVIWSVRLMLVALVMDCLVIVPLEVVAEIFRWPRVGPVAINLASAVLHAGSAFLLTVQEPRLCGTERGFNLRQLIRTVAAVVLLSDIAMGLSELGGNVVARESAFILLYAGMVGYMLELLYLRRLAVRVPAPRLARLTWVTVWGSSITTALIAVLAMVHVVVLPGSAITQRTVDLIHGVGLLLAIVGAVIFIPLIAFVMVRFLEVFSGIRSGALQQDHQSAAQP